MHSNVRCPSQRSTTLGLAVVLSLAGSVLAAPGAQAQDAAITECSTAGLISKITEANQAAGSVTITLAARCTYTLTAAAGTSANGPNGLPVITGDITLDGNNSVIRRAPDAPAFRILEVAETAKLAVNDLLVTGGRTPDAETWDGPAGGGMFNAGKLDLHRVVLSRNQTGNGANAGAEHFNGGDGGDGGAVFNAGELTVDKSAIVHNTTGIGGKAGPPKDWSIYGSGTGGDGGGIYQYSGTTKLTDSLVSGNSAGRAGFTSEWPGAAGNRGGNGGGIGNNWGSVDVVRTRITSNTAGDGAPATPGADGASSETGSGQTGKDGGFGGSGGAGGGIYSYYEFSSLTFDNATIADNRAGNGADGAAGGRGGNGVDGGSGGRGGNGGHGGDGGGLYTRGKVTMVASTVARNKSGNGAKAGASGHGGKGTTGQPGNGRGDTYHEALGGNGGNGGGLCVCSYFLTTGGLTISGSTVHDNNAGSGAQGGRGGDGSSAAYDGYGGGGGFGGSGGSGGGIYLVTEVEALITDTKTLRNTSGNGGQGGFGGDGGGTTGRAGSGGPGGSAGNGAGLMVHEGHPTTVTNSLFRNNKTGTGATGGNAGIGTVYIGQGHGGRGGEGGSGGGVFVSDELKVILDATTVTGNTASPGGAGGTTPNQGADNGEKGLDGLGGGTSLRRYPAYPSVIELKNGSSVTANIPTNCSPAASVPGCTG
jgi:hypothetical protein